MRTDTLGGAARADTVALVTQRDSIRATVVAAQTDLDRLREASAAIDLEEDREREQANAVAPPLALLASAFVLHAIVGFAVAFFGELRRPRLSSAAETEKVLGVRVLSTIEPSAPSIERTRRQSDREAPRYVDPNAEGYQLAYLGLATEHPTVLSAIVTGDDPRISAVVACNLAAIAATKRATRSSSNWNTAAALPRCSMRAPFQECQRSLAKASRGRMQRSRLKSAGRVRSTSYHMVGCRSIRALWQRPWEKQPVD